MGPIAFAIIALSMGGLVYSGYRYNKRRNQRLLREALRKNMLLTYRR